MDGHGVRKGAGLLQLSGTDVRLILTGRLPVRQIGVEELSADYKGVAGSAMISFQGSLAHRLDRRLDVVQDRLRANGRDARSHRLALLSLPESLIEDDIDAVLRQL